MNQRTIKPVFIIGAGHSGTSILYRMLAAHPDFAWFSQYSCRGGEVLGRFKFPLYKYFNRVLRSIFKHSWSKEESGFKFIPRPGDVEQIWDYIFSGGAFRVREFLETECRNWRKDFILLKSIRFQYFLPLLKEAYPEAKFIHIIRDGRAILLSRKYKKGGRGEDRSSEPIENFFPRADGWVETIERINQARGNLGFLEFKYEDFCEDIHGYLKKILNYAGLDAGKFSFNRFPETLTSMNAKWLETAVPSEIAKIENIQREILKKYGYIS